MIVNGKKNNNNKIINIQNWSKAVENSQYGTKNGEKNGQNGIEKTVNMI